MPGNCLRECGTSSPKIENSFTNSLSKACCILSVLFVRIGFELSTVEFVVASSPAYSNAGSNPLAVASAID